MKFVNTEPRKTRQIPEWSKNLANEESKLWLMNNYEMMHIRELISICQFNKMQWIEKYMRTKPSELSKDYFEEVFKKIEKQLQDIQDHHHSISLKNAKIQEELGDNWLKEKH
jgi:hypothetical protein